MNLYITLILLALSATFVLNWHQELRATDSREHDMRVWVAEMRRIHAHRQNPDAC